MILRAYTFLPQNQKLFSPSQRCRSLSNPALSHHAFPDSAGHLRFWHRVPQCLTLLLQQSIFFNCEGSVIFQDVSTVYFLAFLQLVH